MDRNAFLSRGQTKTTLDVTLGDGETLKVRKLSQSEVEHITKHYSSPETAVGGLRYIVSRCVIDDEGNRVFEDGDMKKMAENDFDDLNTIATEVTKFSGLPQPKNP